MIRFFYVFLMNMFRIPYYLGVAEYMLRHPEKYTEEERYALDIKVIKILKRTAGIRTKVFGQEQLPSNGGYVMFANHQGKYDALGIMFAHKQPCSVVMDEKKSHVPIVRQFIDMVDGKRLKKDNIRQAMHIIYEMADEVKKGKKYIIFPSGGYENDGNKVMPFKAGCFKAAIRAKAPIVPVAIIDSYKVFERNTLGRVKTQVHFLTPIFYEEYKEMKTMEIAKMVEERIVECIQIYE
ncbi:MAG: lysophospholipid acyltransferase family protein [Lachnospiraceae bacterium]